MSKTVWFVASVDPQWNVKALSLALEDRAAIEALYQAELATNTTGDRIFVAESVFG